MALKPTSFNTLRSNKISRFKDFRNVVVPGLILLLIPTLSILALGSFLSSIPVTPGSLEANTAFSLNTSGALTLYLNEAEVTCNASAVNLYTPAQDGMSGYTLNLVAPANLMQLRQAHVLDLNQNNLLEFSLVKADNTPYRSFTATQGEARLSSSGNGHLSAFLHDEQGQQLFLNTSWTCPETS